MFKFEINVSRDIFFFLVTYQTRLRIYFITDYHFVLLFIYNKSNSEYWFIIHYGAFKRSFFLAFCLLYLPHYFQIYFLVILLLNAFLLCLFIGHQCKFFIDIWMWMCCERANFFLCSINLTFIHHRCSLRTKYITFIWGIKVTACRINRNSSI